MAGSLSSLADNKDKYKDCKSELEYVTVKENTVTFKYVNCNKNYEKEFDKDLANRFQNKHKICDGDVNRFCLMLRKSVYLYEYIDSWERFNDTSLPHKKEFYSNLTMEKITNAETREESGKISENRT